MYTIEIEDVGDKKFENSNFPKFLEFESREDAYMKAKVLECKLNQELFSDYYYEAVDYGEKIVIHATLTPEDDEDEIDLKALLDKQTSPVVHFDEKKNPDDDIY